MYKVPLRDVVDFNPFGAAVLFGDKLLRNSVVCTQTGLQS